MKVSVGVGEEAVSRLESNICGSAFSGRCSRVSHSHEAGMCFCLAYVVEWCVCVRAESKACKGPLSPLPSTPIPDGVSLGPLMNIDVWGHG